MKWLQQYFKEIDKFPRPDWDKIYEHVEKDFKDQDQHELWSNIAREWINKLKDKLPKEYTVYESENFILLSTENEKYVSLYLKFLERTLKEILKTLPDIASDEGYGKYIVLIFDDIDTYYSYLSYYYSEEGVYGLSSGVFLDNGYGHFAFPTQELSYAETITSHEMTHALLAHLPIPTWLNKGIAVTIEDLITNSSPLYIDKAIVRRHQLFWGEREIQEFWSGEAFHRADEGQELSYHMAQIAVNSLSQDYNNFKLFVNKANYSDGGEAAANDIYEGSLGGLLTQLLGDNDWSPKSENWK